ncbi:MAG TPA: carboxy-S-adenosyl-L-methionine synthase CmoA [Woeseiaceae bacterium]|nr:carboxy-S-adenosyl-L-methionine synthase CmoA [Woeseiaceae bacterium]
MPGPKRDSIYRDSGGNPGSFEFDERVAAVFGDMIRRSVPGYGRTLAEIERLAARAVEPGSVCYDLGCSLGAATLAMARGIAGGSAGGDARIVAVDDSPAMIERCGQILDDSASGVPVELRTEDLRETPVREASLVVLNYTLQFVPRDDRTGLLARIRGGMRDGGILVLSEKIRFADPVLDALFVELHHDFKRANAYSDLEISRKRAALEQVLVPDTAEIHLQRLRRAGFAHAGCWMQELNFASFVAVA